MTNRLANENSPYLLQHADNPVHWYPWGEEALERARQEDKPIFLSIGYAACHWCHVMAHESFEDPQIAALMNENFINIKVDREERPDLDNIYMTAVVAMTGQGGWPMSVFLTPEGEPFYGGTYFPPVRRYGMPSFRDVLLSLARSWKEDRERLLQAGQEVAQHIQQSAALPGAASPAGEAELNPQLLDEAAMHLAQAYDWKFGGWGSAPKFPQPMAIEFLLRRAARGDKMALEMATHALDSMALGGMYDVVGGGFARYSTDDYWRVPHFEKMLYDNGQLARVYLYAFLLTGVDRYRQVCEETLDFIRRELMPPAGETEEAGGIFSSLDADSEGEEGKFYVWTPAEIRAAIANPEDAGFLIAAYGVTEGGNFEGKNVLQRVADDEELAKQFGMPVEDVNRRLKDLHAQLLAARSSRVRPGTDDKVLVAWNALALEAFAEAGRYLQRPDYLEVARLNADFILTELNPAERLLRSWRNGKALHNAYLEDYAGLILGLLALYQSDPDPYWFRSAVQLAEEMVAHFTDPGGGFYDTRDDHEPLLTRPKDIEDNATPSGNSLAAVALLYLSAYTGLGEWRDLAERSIAAIQPLAVRYPTAFGKWLCAMDFAAGPSFEVAILAQPDDPTLASLVEVVWSRFRPHLIAAVSDFPPPTTAPALLNDRPLIDGKPTAYVCQNFTCNRPTADPAELQAQLEPRPSR